LNLKKDSAQVQFLLYNVGAVLSALCDIVFFITLTFFNVHYSISQGIGRIAGGALSFIFNKKFSFGRHQGRTHIEIRRFLVLYLFSYVAALFLLTFYYRIVGLPLVFAKLTTDGTCYIFNFIVMKFYVYAKVKGFTDIFSRRLSNDSLR